MSRYTVVWDEAVETDFLDAWVKSDAGAREALTEIANIIDGTLCNNAETAGKEQSAEGTRAVVIHVPPASTTVYFKVLADDRVVRVTRLVLRRG